MFARLFYGEVRKNVRSKINSMRNGSYSKTRSTCGIPFLFDWNDGMERTGGKKNGYHHTTGRRADSVGIGGMTERLFDLGVLASRRHPAGIRRNSA